MYLGQVIRHPSLPSYVSLTSAGPVFQHHVAATEKRPFKGSVMVVNDTDKENIWKKLSSDVYVKEKIWDLEKAQVIPFQTVLRLGRENKP